MKKNVNLRGIYQLAQKISMAILFCSSGMLFSQTSFQQVELHLEANQYQQAKEKLLAVDSDEADFLKAQEYLGDIAIVQEEWEKASDYYETLVDAHPEKAIYHFKYGAALGLKAKYGSKMNAMFLLPNIKDHLKKAAELDPKDVESRWALVDLYMQLPAIVGGSIQKANQYASELASINTVDGLLAKGAIAEYQENTKRAEQLYQQAITNDKAYADKRMRLFNKFKGDDEKMNLFFEMQ